MIDINNNDLIDLTKSSDGGGTPPDLSGYLKTDGTNTMSPGYIPEYDDSVVTKKYMALERISADPSDGLDFGFGVFGLDRPANGYAPIRAGSIDIVYGDMSVPNKGCGEMSIASGYNNRGNGYGTIVTGWDNIANGNYSMTTGISNTSSGGATLMVGVCLDGSGGDRTLIIGESNTIPSGNPYVIQAGNGTFHGNPTWPVPEGERAYIADERSDAFRVYRAGAVEAPSCTKEMIDETGPRVLVTKEYLDQEIQAVLRLIVDHIRDEDVHLTPEQNDALDASIP